MGEDIPCDCDIHWHVFDYVLELIIMLHTVVATECRFHSQTFSFPLGIEEHQASSMEASLLFGRALREGCITLPRARLFICGPRKSGKSSLKRLLLGLLHSDEEPVLNGVDAETQVAVFDPNSPYHTDSSARSSLPWKLAVSACSVL